MWLNDYFLILDQMDEVVSVDLQFKTINFYLKELEVFINIKNINSSISIQLSNK